MSADQRIPVFSVNPKIEERLRRKREKQRIYDRRRREAAGLTVCSGPAGGTANTATSAAVSEKSSAGSDPRSASNLKTSLKNQTPRTSRRGSLSGWTNKPRRYSVSDTRWQDIPQMWDIQPASVPNMKGNSYISQFPSPPDLFATPISATQPQKWNKSVSQTPLAQTSPTQAYPATFSPPLDSPAEDLMMHRFHQLSPQALQSQPTDIGMAPLPQGKLPTSLLSTGQMPPFYLSPNNGDASQMARPMQRSNKCEIMPVYGYHRSFSSPSIHPMTNISQPRNPSIPDPNLFTPSSGQAAAESGPRKNFSVPQLSTRQLRRAQESFMKHEDRNSHLNLLAADLGIDTIDVTETYDSATSDHADLVSSEEFPYQSPVSAVWDAGSRPHQHQQHQQQTQSQSQYLQHRQPQHHQHPANMSKPGSAYTSCNEAESTDEMTQATRAGQPFTGYKPIYDAIPHPIVEPLLPEMVNLEFFGNDSAQESVFESDCESASDEPPPVDLHRALPRRLHVVHQ